MILAVKGAGIRVIPTVKSSISGNFSTFEGSKLNWWSNDERNKKSSILAKFLPIQSLLPIPKGIKALWGLNWSFPESGFVSKNLSGLNSCGFGKCLGSLRTSVNANAMKVCSGILKVKLLNTLPLKVMWYIKRILQKLLIYQA